MFTGKLIVGVAAAVGVFAGWLLRVVYEREAKAKERRKIMQYYQNRSGHVEKYGGRIKRYGVRK